MGLYPWTAVGKGLLTPGSTMCETLTIVVYFIQSRFYTYGICCLILLLLFFLTQAFFGGGYRLGTAPEESAYVAGAKQASNNQQDVSPPWPGPFFCTP